jgi:hypothetical protein
MAVMAIMAISEAARAEELSRPCSIKFYDHYIQEFKVSHDNDESEVIDTVMKSRAGDGLVWAFLAGEQMRLADEGKSSLHLWDSILIQSYADSMCDKKCSGDEANLLSSIKTTDEMDKCYFVTSPGTSPRMFFGSTAPLVFFRPTAQSTAAAASAIGHATPMASTNSLSDGSSGEGIFSTVS